MLEKVKANEFATHEQKDIVDELTSAVQNKSEMAEQKH